MAGEQPKQQRQHPRYDEHDRNASKKTPVTHSGTSIQTIFPVAGSRVGTRFVLCGFGGGTGGGAGSVPTASIIRFRARIFSKMEGSPINASPGRVASLKNLLTFHGRRIYLTHDPRTETRVQPKIL